MVAKELKSVATDSPARHLNAEKLIRKHMWGAMAIGLIPLPLVDFVGLTGLQLNLLHKVANLYGVEFSKDKGKNVLGAMFASGLPVTLSGPMISLIKTIPVIGTTTGMITLPVAAAGSTYALGKVFVQHFEMGGTLLDFDPEKVKDYFSQEFEAGRLTAHKMRKNSGKHPTP